MSRLFLFPVAFGVLLLLVVALYGEAADAPAVNANHDPPYPSPPTPCQPDAVTLISTGTAGIGNPDPLWTTVHEGVTGQPAVASGPAFGVTRPVSWWPPGGTNNWIDPNTTGDNLSDPGGLYVYETSFSVSAGMQSLTLDFSFAVDNDVKLYLEDPSGTDAPIPLPGTYNPVSNDPNHFNMLHAVNYVLGTPASGTYRLVAEVTNQAAAYPGTGNPTGLLVQGTLTCVRAPCLDPPAGLQAWWPLDEGNGAKTIKDIWGGHNGTAEPDVVGSMGGPWASAGMVGGSLGFHYEGIPSSSVEVPDSPALEPGSGHFSIDAWVKPARYDADKIQPIVDKYDPINDMGYAFYILSPGIFNNSRLMFRYNDGYVDLTVDSMPPPLPYEQWSHVAVTFKRDGVAPSPIDVRLYINGQQQGHQVGGSIGDIASDKTLLIGDRRFFDVMDHGPFIDEVEIFNVALSQPQIEAIYNFGSAGKCPPGGGGRVGDPVVGGVAGLLDDSGSPQEASDSSSNNTLPVAAAIAGIALAFAAGGWYVRRRFARRAR